MAVKVDINAKMIDWALQRAGMDTYAFAEKYPTLKVLDWISNAKQPTVKQLKEFAKKVHVPFGYLFLQSPPKEELPITFFRTGTGKSNQASLNVYDTVLAIQRRQLWLSEYLFDIDYEPLPFVGKFNLETDIKEFADDIRVTLGLSTTWAETQPNWEEALKYLTEQIEEAGIIVSFNSVVENNTHRSIPVGECRGFVLVDEMAPFMFVNNGDAKAAQMFTIAHELAHVWLGVSAGFDILNMQPADDPIEILCDRVAAEFLVPEQSFLSAWEESQDFKALSRRFKVSPIVVSRRALDLGLISKADFFQFYNGYIAEFQRKKENQGPGGNPYASYRKRISPRFTAYVDQALKQNKLLYRDAYRLTGLKGSTLQNLISEHL